MIYYYTIKTRCNKNFELLKSFSERASSLPPNERKDYAEKVIFSFFILFFFSFDCVLAYRRAAATVVVVYAVVVAIVIVNLLIFCFFVNFPSFPRISPFYFSLLLYVCVLIRFCVQVSVSLFVHCCIYQPFVIFH